ncbi:hypothetical protein FRB95_007090 [Tulasnella sp. JGI-2019a]|nr:hypothetical protein FRB95_007090 [Tulasnella sp. JGI-2019a]
MTLKADFNIDLASILEKERGDCRASKKAFADSPNGTDGGDEPQTSGSRPKQTLRQEKRLGVESLQSTHVTRIIRVTALMHCPRIMHPNLFPISDHCSMGGPS